MNLSSYYRSQLLNSLIICLNISKVVVLETFPVFIAAMNASAETSACENASTAAKSGVKCLIRESGHIYLIP